MQSRQKHTVWSARPCILKICMSLVQATTAARVAYSAVALTIIGYPLLDKIEAIRTMPVPKPRGGGVTAELEAAAAAGAAAAAAALKGADPSLAGFLLSCSSVLHLRNGQLWTGVTQICMHACMQRHKYLRRLLHADAGARAKKGDDDTINTRNKATRR